MGHSGDTVLIRLRMLPMTVFHLSRATSKPLKEILGGDEAKFMTPAIASNLSVLDAVVSCWFDTESVDTEVSLFNRSLDILAKAEIPGSGEETNVAIENQYGFADPDHFGRLIGWYMPETNSEMGILIAESFEPHLINAVSKGLIFRPRFGLWLVEATGQMIGETCAVSYTLRASSLERDVQIAREKAFRQNQSFSAADSQARMQYELEETEALFGHIAKTGNGALSREVARQNTVSRWYRKLSDSGRGCHLSLFVGSKKISIGSVYLKGSLSPSTLDQLTELNNNIELEPNPSKREMRSIWWNISEMGRGVSPEKWPDDLGALLDEKYEELLPILHEHQARLLQIIESDATS